MARNAEIIRNTKETRICLTLDLDGAGAARVHTGIGFFDHMLESFARHGGRVTKILPAELGNDAGIIGAAMLGRVM